MQPLSNIPGVTHVSFVLGRDAGNNPFEKRPRLAPFCIDAIAAASQVEASLLQLFMWLMGGSYQVSAKMYLALDTRGPKSAAIKAAAEAVLSPWHLEVFGAITRLNVTGQKHRDKLAHWAWGYSDDLPDALLLTDPRHFPLDFHPRGMADFLNNWARWSDRVFAYEEHDFRAIASDLKDLAHAIQRFRYSLVYKSAEQDRKLFAELCTIAAFQGKLSHPA